MEYRTLGDSGLQVSVAGLGTNNFGGRCDLEQTKAVVHKAIEVGLNFIDTAESYGRGLSEEFIGKAIEGHRQEVLLTTKFGGRGKPGTGGRSYIKNAVHGSLQRLNTDYIDMLSIHFPDPSTPIEETMRALDDLVRAGDVRYLGCSNFAAWQLVEAEWAAKTAHSSPFIASQNPYSLLQRNVEQDLAPACVKYGVGVIPYSPLAGGFLTGKYRQNEAPTEGTRLAGGQGARQLNDDNFAKLAKLETFAHEHDHTVGELALAWLASQPFVGSVIAGATKPEQVEENVRAIEWHLSAEDMKALDEAMGVGAEPMRGGPGR